MDSDDAATLDAIRRIVRLLRLSARQSESRSGLSSAQLFLLQKLAESRAASIAELARRALADASSVSVVVAQLVKRKLVRRKRDPVDARRTTLELTAQGTRLLAKAPEPAQAKLLKALRRMPPRERRGLARGLGAFIRALALEGGTAPLFFEQERS